MKKVQVIHFVETLGKGGLENVVFHITTRLDPQVFDVAVVCRIEGGYTADRIVSHGVPLQILRRKKIPLLDLKKTLSLLRTQTPSILHCHVLFATTSEAIMGKQAGYDSVFVHVHNLEKPKRLLQRLKLKILKRTVNTFIAVSGGVYNSLFENSIRNVEVIPNGVDTERYSFYPAPKQEKFNFPKNTLVLGMIGRIVKRKGFDHFVEIIQNISDVSGVIVGEGPYEEHIKSKIAERNLGDRIKFLPFQSQEALPTIYANLDALFLFSEKEGLPLALLEAQSVGVPYIGNAVGGIGEVVNDGYNGFILERFDIEQVRDRISKLRGNPAYYRKNARMVVKDKYSMVGMIRAIEKLYIESLS
ncbi:MAG: glycosyltransferase family 4 protein [Pseudomonadota bacterium]